MRFGAAISSFLLHLCVALLVFFGLPSFFEPEFDMTQSIAVEIVTVAEISNPPPPTPAPKPEPVDTADIPPPPDPLPEPDPVPPEPEALPEPPPPEPAPKPEVVEAPPPPPAPEPEPEPEVVEPPPEPEPEVVEAPPPPLKPERLAALDVDTPPAPPSKPKPPAKKQQFDTLLQNLAESAPKPPAPEPEIEQAAPEPTPSTVTSARDEPLSMTVSDSIRRQVEEKWSVPAGARDAGELDVEIYISLLPDGTVRKAEIVDRARMLQPGGEYYRSMAESALRAVLQASPLHDLPPDRYEDWREITFRFRPPV